MAKKDKTIKLFEIKKNESDIPMDKIHTSMDAAKYIKRFYFDDIEVYESFFMLMLNRSNTTVAYAKISQGGTVGTVVDIKLIAKYALDSLCQSVILAHNHPSGNTKPSDQDMAITKKVQEALTLFDIKILDHVILTKDGYYSCADNGVL